MTAQELEMYITKIDQLIEEARENLGVPSKRTMDGLYDRLDDIADNLYDCY